MEGFLIQKDTENVSYEQSQQLIMGMIELDIMKKIWHIIIGEVQQSLIK